MASIKQQPNGKWRYRVRYKENGEFREVSKGGFRTKRDAQTAANELERKLNSGLVVQHNKDILVQEYLSSWIKLKEKQVRKSTLAKLNRAIRLHILPQFAYYKMTEIRHINCINWVNEMYTHLSIESARSYCSTFNNALEDAINDFKLIDSNPMKNIKYPKTEKRKTAIQFFEERELQNLLVTAGSYRGTKPFIDYQYYVLTFLLARTRLKLDEALALKWEDITEDKLTVSKTLYRENNQSFITTPKTISSYRAIILDERCIGLLKSFKIKRIEHSLKSNAFILNKEFVFTDSKGDFLKQCSYRTYFTTICTLADVPKLSPHALRHSHAVHLLEGGSNIKFVSERLDHHTINMTANVYLHVSKKMETESISRYENFL